MVGMPNNQSTLKCFQTPKLKLIFNFITAALVPILVGLFTVILALQQKSIAKENREMDLYIAINQHRQNLELAIDEQRNAQFVAYIREISDLLLVNSFSLNKQILMGIVRPKTLATLRQIDVIRKGYLVSFFGAYLENATFVNLSLGGSSFGGAYLRGASFHSAALENVIFDSVAAQETDFTGADVYAADFTAAKLTNAKITAKQLSKALSISKAILPDGSVGQNPNLLLKYNCQELNYTAGIQQNISLSRYQELQASKGLKSGLMYLLTGWFDNPDNVQAHFSELGRNGSLLHRYCVSKQDLTPYCQTISWIGAVILFRNVEHFRNQFRSGIDSVQFRELARHIISDTHSKIDRVPSNSGIGGNSVQFRNR
ncbi:unnamed protein product [Adineta steineri]|uniref:Pentapeptide repeat-containing protein n=1 Tax=Adineta steineri TaxID=433720 RepID=A0A818VT07_9BILA|nr:unnamed protein product [Adineta steineri]